VSDDDVDAIGTLVAEESNEPIDPSLVFGNFSGGYSTGSSNAQAIDRYLLSKGSPMVGSGMFFAMSGQRWGIDPRLIVAIAGAESNFGATTCGAFNAWGWSCPASPVQFGSWPEGIETIAEGLRRYYIDEGRTTIPKIQQKYAPNGASNDPTDLNSHWVNNVMRFFLEQGGNPDKLVTGPSLVPIGGDPIA
jgi:hypothetical protein